MTVMRRMGGIAAALALFGAAPLAAQYFGKNKVQYQAFDFKIIQTEHFEVYYYPAERTAALDAARMAERWYARLSRILHHQFQGRKPIILYASQSDFQQTNVTDVFEGLQGSTDFFKHRMVLPFTGSYAEFEHVIGHEMVHQFQFDVISRGRIGAGVQTLVNANLPLWFMEGMAEYLSIGPIDPLTSMTLRDASLEGHLPTIEEMTYDPRIFPYHFGHALLAYVGEKWGDEAIGQILQASVSSGVEGGFKRSLGITLGDRSGQAAARQVHVELELREPSLHQLRGLVLARRAVFRDRREAQGPRRSRHSRCEEGQRGPPHPRPAQRAHDAVVVARREAAGVHRVRRRTLGPVHRERRRLEPPPPDERQVRRPRAVLVPRRQDHRVHHRSQLRYRLRGTQVRQPADRPVPPRQRLDRYPPAHGPGEEHQSRLGPGRPVAGVRVRPQRDQQHLPVRLVGREYLPAHRRVHGSIRNQRALAVPLLGARSGSPRVRLL